MDAYDYILIGAVIGVLLGTIIWMAYLVSKLRARKTEKIQTVVSGVVKSPPKVDPAQIASQSQPPTCDPEDQEEKTRAEAKTNAQCFKENLQKRAIWISIGLWFGWLILTVIFSIGIALLVGDEIGKYQIQLSIVLFSLLNGLAIGFGFRKVHHMQEFTVEFLGQIFTVWESGPHVLFPFLMSISGKVYMGDQITTLYMDEKERDGEVNAFMEFTDTSAAVIIRLIYRFFDAIRAVYNVDDVEYAVREKMDAGLRAYYGGQNLDEAIEKRAELDLQKIIEQKATQAFLFKLWGTDIRSVAVVDIGLPANVKEQRDKVLTAEKDREVAEIKIETAEKEGEAIRRKQQKIGSAAGQEIQKLKEDSGLETPELAATYLLNTRYFESIKGNKGIVIAGQGTGAPLMGAELGAALSLASDQFKDKAAQPEEKTKEPKPEKKEKK